MTDSPAPQNKTKILACATVIEEMLPIMPANVDYEVLEFGLHIVPENLKKALQAAIDACSPQYETIILGYGMCSMAVIGLHAPNSTLVVPRVDDCIALFLGSRETYNSMAKSEPGTYYLTKGWIAVGDTILTEYQRTIQRYGEEKGARIMGQMFRRYKRLVYIDTGLADQEEYIAYAKRAAEQLKLRFEKIKGSNTLVKKMLYGPWDDEFVVVGPGETITYKQFTPVDAEAKGSEAAPPGAAFGAVSPA